jgi:DNA gyrase subunit A
VLITQQGKITRIDSSQVRETGRSAQGVKLISLEEGDLVSAAGLVEAEENGNGNGGSAQGTLIQ